MPNWPGGYGLEPLWPHAADHLNAAIQVDIIFVHGLNGDPAHTWSCEGPNGKKISWLSDNGFLPSMIPLSRIFTFKYNARILNYNSDAALDDISKSLLSHVHNIRLSVEEINRKLLFVCHSLGGLVVKQALILEAETEALKAIQDKTAGIIFLGTPHGGSHLGRSLARIAFVTGSSKDLSSVLSIDSDTLNNLSAGFKDYYTKRLAGADDAAPRLRIRSFAEMDRTYIAHTPIATKVVPLKSAQTYLDREIVTPVNKDHHHTICRFSSPDDPVFVMIWRQLSEWMAQPGAERRARANSLERVSTFDREQYYDAPLKTEDFVGREEDLRILSDALFQGGRETHRSVGLYGQGGIGKTQLVIEFARVHKSYYKTVKFFNARSKEDLKASIEKFFDSLIERKDERMQKMSGKGCKDKTAAVMKWFREERDWLLVYDDADFDPPYDPRSYFPQDSSGHLILIGRGPSVTDFAETAVELVPMNREDTIQMLLVRSKFARHAGSSDESEGASMQDAADDIANELHDMPGFIEVAAKYILHCQPSLTEYLQMLRNKKQNMRLESEKGVLGDAFASWELSLNKIRTRPASMLLLKLFAFLDGSISCERLRSRAFSPARRWNKNGEEVERSPQWSGIDQALIEIVRDSETFDSAVTPLINASFLRKQHSGSTSKIEMLQTIQQFVQWSMTPSEQLHWTMQAIRVISHALPEGPHQDTRFESLRLNFTPHVFRCIDHKRKYKFSIEQLKEVLPNLMIMLLASLARSGIELDYVEELAAAMNDGYYRCLASKWRGYSLFYQDRKREAEQLLAHVQAYEEEQEMLASRGGHVPSPRAHAALGDLIMHRAQFLFNEGRYEESEEAIQSWKPISTSHISTYEKRTKLDLDTALDKVRVATGQVDLAVKHLQEVVERGRPGLEDHGLKSSDVNWATVILCQVYCFQGKYREVISELQPRIDLLMSSGSQAEFITSDFRTLFCEALMGLQMFGDAERELTNLCKDLRLPAQIDNKRASNQRFATLRMIARCYHLQEQWEKAAEAWSAALQHEKIGEVEILSGGFDRRRYDVLVSIYSLGLAHLKLGNKKLAQQYIDVAKADPAALEYPRGKTDYTRWNARVEQEYSTAMNGNRGRLEFWRLIFGRGSHT